MSDVKDTDANAAASPEDVGPRPCPGIGWWGLSLAVSLPDPSATLGDAPLLGSGVAANRKTDHGATDALAGPSPGAPLWHLDVSDR